MAGSANTRTSGAAGAHRDEAEGHLLHNVGDELGRQPQPIERLLRHLGRERPGHMRSAEYVRAPVGMRGGGGGVTNREHEREAENGTRSVGVAREHIHALVCAVDGPRDAPACGEACEGGANCILDLLLVAGRESLLERRHDLPHRASRPPLPVVISPATPSPPPNARAPTHTHR